MKFLFLFLFIHLLAFKINAQYSKTIRADRPSQSIGAFTVGKNILQFEQGLEYDKDLNSVKNPSAFITNHVIRFGILKHVEISTLFDYQKNNFTVNDSSYSYQGISNFHLGFRVHLSDQKGILPSTCFQVRLKMPDVSKEYGIKNLAPEMVFVANWKLPKKISLGTNWIYTTNGNSAKATGKYTINLGFPIYKKFSGFIENYGQLRGDVFQTRFDAGFAYIASNNVQLDASAGYGDNNNEKDYFVSGGISWRLNFNKKNPESLK